MAFLAALSTLPSPALWRSLGKYGLAPGLVVVLVWFLMQTVSAGQAEIQAALVSHQQDSRDQLEMLRIICVSVARPELADYCLAIGRQR